MDPKKLLIPFGYYDHVLRAPSNIKEVSQEIAYEGVGKKLMFKHITQKLFSMAGYTIMKKSKPLFIPDMEDEFKKLYEECKDYTLTSVERMYALYKAAEYIVSTGVSGDIVECGTYKGGSAMMLLKALVAFSSTQRKVYLYDTYAGMSEPTKKDISFKNKSAQAKWGLLQKGNFNEWDYAPIEEVKANVYSSGYPKDNLIFIKGKVEDTIPKTLPDTIALLHLDTDWYESTYHELYHLYPHLSLQGIIIIDDYGHWKGAKEAVDKYFREQGVKILLHRVDYTGRIGIKVGT